MRRLTSWLLFFDTSKIDFDDIDLIDVVVSRGRRLNSMGLIPRLTRCKRLQPATKGGGLEAEEERTGGCIR